MKPDAIINTDGGSRGNPGPAACAYIIQRPGQPDIEAKYFLGKTTNNIAEYTGVIKALEHATRLNVARVLLRSDSELLVNQLKGEYKVKNEGLRPLFLQAKELVTKFDHVKFQHVYREDNMAADQLCNEALDDPGSHMVGSVTGDDEPGPENIDGEALLLLDAARTAWRDGKGPEVNEVWRSLKALMERSGG